MGEGGVHPGKVARLLQGPGDTKNHNTTTLRNAKCLLELDHVSPDAYEWHLGVFHYMTATSSALSKTKDS